MATAIRGRDGASRGALLEILRGASEAMTLAELADRAGLAPTTTRFHLDQLVASRTVRVGRRPAGRPGRPPLLYRAAPVEAVDGGAAYRLLAGLLAEELLEVGGTAAPLEAGRRWAARMTRDTVSLVPPSETTSGTTTTDSTTDSTTDHTADGVVRAVAAFFSDGGFAPEVVDGSTIALHRCPFLDLAREQSAAVCTVHVGLLQGLLDALGSARQPRLEAVVDGSGPCVVRLGPPPRPGRPS